MFAACQALGLKAGDEILTPAFDCDGALQPFRVLGLKLHFFRINPYTFEADLDDLKSKWTSRIRMIHLINYFGFSQPWDEILKLKQELKTPILEDNAYSLFSSYKSEPLGSFGDVAIFSLRKNLPLIDGGALKINNEAYQIRLSLAQPKWIYRTEWVGLLGFMKRRVRICLGIRPGLLKTPSFLKKWKPDYFPPPPLYSEPPLAELQREKGFPHVPGRDAIGFEFALDYLRPMSRFSRKQFQKFTDADPTFYDEISRKRRESYRWLSKRLSLIPSIELIHSKLPEGATPHCISFLINSHRDTYFENLRKKYDVMAWPTLPQEVIDQLERFPDVELLGRKIFQINFSAASHQSQLENLCDDLETLEIN
jgi:hypothetical protein